MPLRVLAVASAPLDAALALADAGGAERAGSRERHGGPPFWWYADLAAPAAGTYRIALRTGDAAACAEVSVADEAAPAPPRAWGAAWAVHAAWDRATEALYSAWIEKLFDAPWSTSSSPSPPSTTCSATPRATCSTTTSGRARTTAGRARHPSSPTACRSSPTSSAPTSPGSSACPSASRAARAAAAASPPHCLRWHSNLEADPAAPPPRPTPSSTSSASSARRRHRLPLRHGAHPRRRGLEATTYPVPLPPLVRRKHCARAPSTPTRTGTSWWSPSASRRPRAPAACSSPSTASPTAPSRAGASGAANFLVRARPGAGQEPGWKRFRPVVLDAAGRPRVLHDAEIAASPDYGDLSLAQYEAGVEGFYDSMYDLLSPAPLDPSRALGEVISALRGAGEGPRPLRRQRRQALRASGGGTAIDMPDGAAIFETTGPWEDFSTPRATSASSSPSIRRLVTRLPRPRGPPPRALRHARRQARRRRRKADLDRLLHDTLEAALRFSYERSVSRGSAFSLLPRRRAESPAPPRLEMAYDPQRLPRGHGGARALPGSARKPGRAAAGRRADRAGADAPLPGVWFHGEAAAATAGDERNAGRQRLPGPQTPETPASSTGDVNLNAGRRPPAHQRRRRLRPQPAGDVDLPTRRRGHQRSRRAWTRTPAPETRASTPEVDLNARRRGPQRRRRGPQRRRRSPQRRRRGPQRRKVDATGDEDLPRRRRGPQRRRRGPSTPETWTSTPETRTSTPETRPSTPETRTSTPWRRGPQRRRRGPQRRRREPQRRRRGPHHAGDAEPQRRETRTSNAGDADLHAGDVDLHAGDASLQAGDVDLHAGDARLHAGDADLYARAARRRRQPPAHAPSRSHSHVGADRPTSSHPRHPLRPSAGTGPRRSPPSPPRAARLRRPAPRPRRSGLRQLAGRVRRHRAHDRGRRLGVEQDAVHAVAVAETPLDARSAPTTPARRAPQGSSKTSPRASRRRDEAPGGRGPKKDPRRPGLHVVHGEPADLARLCRVHARAQRCGHELACRGRSRAPGAPAPVEGRPRWRCSSSRRCGRSAASYACHRAAEEDQAESLSLHGPWGPGSPRRSTRTPVNGTPARARATPRWPGPSPATCWMMRTPIMDPGTLGTARPRRPRAPGAGHAASVDA